MESYIIPVCRMVSQSFTQKFMHKFLILFSNSNILPKPYFFCESDSLSIVLKIKYKEMKCQTHR